MDRQPKPILLYDDQCSVCRHIASWVRKSAKNKAGETSILDRPIGNDPEALRMLNPALDIWDAYATIHVLMPDGSMRLGGEAVAEVLRQLPETRWFTWMFAFAMLGFRPFQAILNLAYSTLADVRPIFGCESCGSPAPWVKPIRWLVKLVGTAFGVIPKPSAPPHFTRIAFSTPRSPSQTMSATLPSNQIATTFISSIRSPTPLASTLQDHSDGAALPRSRER